MNESPLPFPGRGVDHILKDYESLLAAQRTEMAAEDVHVREAWARERCSRWLDLVLFSHVFLAWTALTVFALAAVLAGYFIAVFAWVPLGSIWLVFAGIWRDLFAAARESLTWGKEVVL